MGVEKYWPSRTTGWAVTWLLTWGLWGCQEGAKGVEQWTVLSIGDGDTIRVQGRQGKTTVRLACIDAPEKAQIPVGEMARNGLASLAPVGSTISLEAKGQDRYGRTVGIVYRKENEINLTMVRLGLAFAYRKYLGQCNAEDYIKAENEAKKRKEGMWGTNWQAQEPWKFRKNKKDSTGKTMATPLSGKTCAEIGDWKTAQRLLEAGQGSLDRDKDGIACEGLLKK